MFRFASPTEPFWVYTKLAMYGALLVASPFIFWEIWRFVAPGLYKREKRMALVVTLRDRRSASSAARSSATASSASRR